MKILLIHNKYKQAGGEDAIFEMEKSLLEGNNHQVKAVVFDNAEIDNLSKTLKLSYQLVYNKKSKAIIEDAIIQFKPDVIHVHNFFYLASPSIFFAAHQANIPIIVTLHNYRLICSGSLLMRNDKPCELCTNQMFPLHGIKYGCHRDSRVQTAQLTLATGIHKFLRTWSTKVTEYICLTNFAKAKFTHSSLQLRPENIVVKPNSVDDIKPSDFSERDNFFLFIGRLSQEKGIEVLLKAFANSNHVIEIIGDGPLRHLVVEAALQNPSIKYSGYQDKTVVYNRLRKSKALIVPSICYENLPTAILEAFAAGTPVIISDIGNLNEIVSNNYNGIHFKTNNANDLIRVVASVAANPQEFQPLYKNARRTFESNYTHEINYSNLMRIYQDAIQRVKTNADAQQLKPV